MGSAVIHMTYYTEILLLIGALLIPLIAQLYVKMTFNTYAGVRNSRHITGEEAARSILDNNGCSDVRIEHISGKLSDHYDPRARVLRLSDSTYGMDTIAAVGIAAHEAGHAIQHAEGYAFMKIRSAFVPVVSICSNLWYIMFIAGIILRAVGLIEVAIILFSSICVFQLITLPVEFNASNRAIDILECNGMLEFSEVNGTSKVLRAAAMTYIAALLSSVLQLLRLILISNRRR